MYYYILFLSVFMRSKMCANNFCCQHRNRPCLLCSQLKKNINWKKVNFCFIVSYNRLFVKTRTFLDLEVCRLQVYASIIIIHQFIFLNILDNNDRTAVRRLHRRIIYKQARSDSTLSLHTDLTVNLSTNQNVETLINNSQLARLS